MWIKVTEPPRDPLCGQLSWSILEKSKWSLKVGALIFLISELFYFILFCYYYYFFLSLNFYESHGHGGHNSNQAYK